MTDLPLCLWCGHPTYMHGSYGCGSPMRDWGVCECTLTRDDSTGGAS